MFKNFILMLLLSILVILFVHPFAQALNIFVYFHQHLSNFLATLFSQSTLAVTSVKVLSLLLIPLITGLIIGGGYYLLRKKEMPYVFEIMWLVWLVIGMAIVH